MMKKFVLLVCLFLMPLTLVSETQHRFRVFVDVRGNGEGDNPHIRNILETRLKKELRLLGDVDIVEWDEEWHFILDVFFAQNKFTSGTEMEWISIAEGFYQRVPRSYFRADRYSDLLFPPVYLDGLGVAFYKIDRLEAYCVKLVGHIDKEEFTPIRELLR